MINVLTVDVEDYFHPSEVQRSIPRSDWDGFPARIAGATRQVLEALAAADTKATFFILGWVAERHPDVVREIASSGHEIGCHSFHHELVYDMTPEQFRADTERACQAVEAACGMRPRLYRAPSYSITADSLWALDILAELGFTHDSSVYPIRHDRYGIPGFPCHAHERATTAGPIIEVPIATARLSATKRAPVGGGAYLRLFPYRYTAAGIRRLNQDESRPACIYFHPWELDTGQPRLPIGRLARLRTYSGLDRMHGKLTRLLAEFKMSTMTAVHPAPKAA